MNKNLIARLQNRMIALTRAANSKDLLAMKSAHKGLGNTVSKIYNAKIDPPTVFRVEQIINDGTANVLGKSNEAHQLNEMLAMQAKVGLEIYEKFARDPEIYVEFADATRKGVRRGKPFLDGVPYDPIRSGLVEFREELVKDLVPRSGDPFPERERANRLRLEATVLAERGYIEAFIGYRGVGQKLKERQREDSLGRFGSRVRRQVLRTEPESELPNHSVNRLMPEA